MIDGFDYLGGGYGGMGGGRGNVPPEKRGQKVPQPVKVPVPAKPAPAQKAVQEEKAWAVKTKVEPDTTEKKQTDIPIPVGEKAQAEKSNIVRIGTGEGTDNTQYFGLGEGSGSGVGVGTGDGTGFGGSGFGFGSYLSILRRKIWSEWTQSAVYGTGLSCVIGLTVTRNGDVKDVKMEQTSGNSFYDNVAQRAVRNASPLPPLPQGFQGSEQRFRIKFVLLE